MRGLDKPPGYFGPLLRVIENGGTFRFLRAHQDGDQQRLLCRLLSENGVNYYDLLAIRRPDGKLVFIDCYVYFAGEDASATFRREYLKAMTQADRTIWQRITQQDSATVRSLEHLNEMNNLIKEGKPKEALAVYDRMPEEARRDKTVLLCRLVAAQSIDEAAQTAALADFEKYHRNDPAWLLMSIDAYTLRKMYPRAGGDRPSRQTGGRRSVFESGTSNDAPNHG